MKTAKFIKAANDLVNKLRPQTPNTVLGLLISESVKDSIEAFEAEASQESTGVIIVSIQRNGQIWMTKSQSLSGLETVGLITMAAHYFKEDA